MVPVREHDRSALCLHANFLAFKNEHDVRDEHEGPLSALHMHADGAPVASLLHCLFLAGFGGSIELASILEFVDAGHDDVTVAAPGAADIIRDLALECGVDMDEVSILGLVESRPLALPSSQRAALLEASSCRLWLS